jgi:hypothetical protein
MHDANALPAIDLVFVHIPKTGGTAAKAALVQAYGAENVYHDYDDDPGNPLKPISIDPIGYLEKTRRSLTAELAERRVVVGHLWFKKYENTAPKCVATVLRDPISRAISHYFYWLAGNWPGHPVHSYLVSQSLSIEQFARLPLISGLYANLFFKDVDMGTFDFVMRHEELSRRWPDLTKRLGIAAELPILGTTQSVDSAYTERAGNMLADAKLMSRLRAALRSDIDFYERHVR